MISLGQCLEEFLHHLQETGRKPRTIEAYQWRLKPLMKYLGENCDITTITASSVHEFIDGFEGHNKRTRAVAKSIYIQATKTFFQFCCNSGWIAESPAKTLIRPTRAKPSMDRASELLLISPIEANKMTFEVPDSIPAMVDEFLGYLAAMGRRPRTLQIYTLQLAPLINYFIGVKPDQIAPRHIDSYIISLKRRMREVTVSGHTQATKYFFRFCCLRGYLASSPAAHLRRGKFVSSEGSKVIDQGDLEAMIQFARDNGRTRDYCLLLFMADTGARTGEIIGLDLCDLDLDNGEAVVLGKTGRRVIYFTEGTAKALRLWLEVRPNTDMNATFTTREGRISHAAIYHSLQRIATKLGIKRFNPHSIRHRVGQAWVDQGANLELVRLKLGHNDVNTTALFYTHQDGPRIKSATNRFSILPEKGGNNASVFAEVA